MKKLIILIFGIATLLGCSKDPSDINIRLLNTTETKFENIKVDTSNELVDYGDLDSNQYSEFKTFEIAYRYAYIEFEIGDETHRFIPADYTGESILENGDYTYKINIDPDDTIGISIQLIEE